MKTWFENHCGWYDRQPVWIRIVAFPIVFLVALIYNVVVLPYILVVLFVAIIQATAASRRFWQRLGKRGQVVRWPELRQEVTRKNGTLLVEIGPKGPGYSWWLSQSRNEVDPEHRVQSLYDFEKRGWDIFDAADYDRVEQWAVEQLGAYESSAKAVAVSGSQLSKLPVEVKREVVLVILCCNGTLSSRLRSERTC